jgi:cytochrome P450
MLEQIDILLRLLVHSSEKSETVDLTPRIQRLSFDITALLAFGSPLHTQTDATYRGIVEAQTLGTYRSSIFIQYPFLRKTKIFDLVEILSKDVVTQYYRTLEKLISTRVAEEKHARHDLYSLIVDQINPDGQFLMDSDIWAEASFFFPAGAETVSTLMCAALFYLAHNSHAYAQVAKEIRETFGSANEIKGGPKLSSCKYLRACLDETMRMSPPAPGMSWRELDVNDPTGEPFMVDGHVVTKNTEVAISVYSILHNEEYFPNSFEFRPERWLETETPEEQRKVMLQAFTPFSLGSRNCGGKAMAYSESSLVVAKILWFFDFELAPGALGKVGEGNRTLGKGREREGEYQLYDQFVANHKGPNLVFRQRGDFCKELTES